MKKSMPITELIAEMRTGNNYAFTDLFNFYIDEATAAAKKRLESLPSRTSSESVGIASLMQCLQKGRFKERRGLRKFMYCVIDRRVIDAVRQATAGERDVRKTEKRDLELVEHSLAPSPDQIAMCRELGEQIAEVVHNEPDEFAREVRVLGILCGYTPAQIHDRLNSKGETNITMGAIYRQLARVKRQLKEQFGGEWGE